MILVRKRRLHELRLPNYADFTVERIKNACIPSRVVAIFCAKLLSWTRLSCTTIQLRNCESASWRLLPSPSHTIMRTGADGSVQFPSRQFWVRSSLRLSGRAWARRKGVPRAFPCYLHLPTRAPWQDL